MTIKQTMALQKSRKLEREALKGYALRILSGRGLSLNELREKLRQRAAKAPDIDTVIGDLKEYGFINDQQFAENFASSRLDSRGFGKQRVLSDLLKRRVAPKVAESAVSGAFEGVDELALIEQFLERKYRNKDLPALLQDPKQLASVYRRLRAAGFSSGPSIRILKRFAQQAEELESLEEPETGGT